MSWIINASTTAALAPITTFVTDNGPQSVLFYIGILSALFLIALAFKGAGMVWRFVTGRRGRRR